MKKMSLTLKSMIGLGLMVISSLPLRAAPASINYQGKLISKTTGTPITSPVNNVKFRFFDSPSGGSLKHNFGPVTITPTQGVFSQIITVPPDLFSTNSTVYLEIEVGGVAFNERQQLVAAPYALAVVDDAVGTLQIKNGAVTKDKLATDAVETLQIKNGAVTKDKLATDAVETLQIKNGAVTNDKLGTEIDAGKLTGTLPATLDASQLGGLTATVVAPDAVDTLQIKNGAVTKDKLATDAVETLQIKDLAVTTEKLADGAVTRQKIGSLTITLSDIGPGVLSDVYKTNDGRLILGNSYKTSMCGVSEGAARFSSCGGACDQTDAQNCTASVIVGHLVQ